TEDSAVGETTFNDTSVARSIDGTLGNSVTAGGFCVGSSPNPNPNGPPSLSALPLPSWQQGINLDNNPEIANPPARMVPDVSMIADRIAIACGVGTGGCGLSGSFGETACVGGTSASAPLFAGFIALVNQANGVGNTRSPTPIGFANPILYRLATSTRVGSGYTNDFNDVQDGTNNNWFDDGQVKESGTVPLVGSPVPAVVAPYSVDTSADPLLQNTHLHGSAPVGASEAPGLYHAVTGYDLVNGLGSPNCGLLNALAPSTATPPPPTPPPAVVTIIYHQVGECNGFPDSEFPEDQLGQGERIIVHVGG
ncbi:MAG: hypothetical protein ACREJ3_09985, partial [Polyangiaceae bacterium]